MLIKTHTCIYQGLQTSLTTVEVSLVRGKYGIKILGLPGRAVKESWARIFTSFRNMSLYPPPQKVVVNLVPAHVRKIGSQFDVPIAVGILAAAGMVQKELLDTYLLAGELSLDGSLRPMREEHLFVKVAKQHGFRGVILPVLESRKIDGVEVIAVNHLKEVIGVLQGTIGGIGSKHRQSDISFSISAPQAYPDFSEVKGQQSTKRALEIAVAGWHHACLIGPPGSGKTLLANCIPSILPPMSEQEQWEVEELQTIHEERNVQFNKKSRPFRSPHHSTSMQALIGGGSKLASGEFSLAHHGVLFLDELAEFPPLVMNGLRKVLEDRRVSLSSSRMSTEYAANCLLIAAYHPCPCGYHGHPDKICTCTPSRIQHYLNRVHRPLRDWIDLHIELKPVSVEALFDQQKVETSEQIRQRVLLARERQASRFQDEPGVYSNAMMPTAMVRQLCSIDKKTEGLLQFSGKKYGFSNRAYDQILKVARTIADLADEEKIKRGHVAEAIEWRHISR